MASTNKRWYLSKSIRVGLLTLVGAIVEGISSGQFTAPNYVVVGLGLAQIVLRFFTDQPIAPLAAPPNPNADR